MNTQARVVIVGGGIMGVSLLYHLAEAGWHDCLLIEKGDLTSGSTWHAAGQCPSFIADYNMAKIHDYGVRLYPRLEAITGQYVGWHGCGGIRLATKPAEVDWFRHVAGVGRLIGFECEIIDPQKIKQLNPFITTDGVLAGAWTLNDGHVDPSGVTQALAKGARRMGADIVTRNRVLEINLRASGDWEVVTEQGSVICEHVVNAAGCYARQVAQMAGTDVAITNIQHTYLVTETVPEFQQRAEELPVMRDPHPSAYYRQEQKSALIGIYETENSIENWAERGGWPHWNAENELFDADLGSLSRYLERVMQRMPIWSELGIKRVVCGAIPHTPDANPYLGPAVGLRHFWQCNGASIGIAAGAGCGKYLSQWMVYGDAEINMAGLDPRRFARYAPGSYTKAKSHQDYEHMYALHLPGEERPAARKTRITPLYDRLLKQGCVYTEVNGWERPKWFSPDNRVESLGFGRSNAFDVVAAECRAVRERVGVMDLSSFAKYEVSGADAERLLNRITANKMPQQGGIALAHYLSAQGRINGESTITRLGAEHYYLLSAAVAEEADYDRLAQAVLPAETVRIDRVSDHWGVLVVAGPRARDVLAPLTAADLTNRQFPWLTAREITLANIPLRALRINYVGELGWELHCPMAHLSALYDAVWQSGQAHGIANFGAYAVNSLRMEKAYKGWGAELTNEITLIEAASERFFCAQKKDFIGREATLAGQHSTPKTRLVYFEVEPGEQDIQGGEAVLVDERPIGVTTSGGYGHTTSKSLGFAYVESEYAAPGSLFEVDILGQRRRSQVLPAPVWDADASRSRG